MSTVLGGRESVGEGLESGDSAVLLAYLVKSLSPGSSKKVSSNSSRGGSASSADTPSKIEFDEEDAAEVAEEDDESGDETGDRGGSRAVAEEDAK